MGEVELNNVMMNLKNWRWLVANRLAITGSMLFAYRCTLINVKLGDDIIEVTDSTYICVEYLTTD